MVGKICERRRFWAGIEREGVVIFCLPVSSNSPSYLWWCRERLWPGQRRRRRQLYLSARIRTARKTRRGWIHMYRYVCEDACSTLCISRFLWPFCAIGQAIIFLPCYAWSPYVIGQTIIFCPVISIFFFLLLFSSPNLSGRRLDVYHVLRAVLGCGRLLFYVHFLQFLSGF